VLKGIAVHRHRNPILAINVMIKATSTGTVTDLCGEFSIPVDQKSVTLVFQGMSFDDMRTYEIQLEKRTLRTPSLYFNSAV